MLNPQRLTCRRLSPQSSDADATPSPNTLLGDHPLSAFIKEEEEEAPCCIAAAVKQEVESEAAEPPDMKKETDVLPDEEV